MAITVGNHYTSWQSRSGSFNTYYFYAEWFGNTDGDNITNRYFYYEYGTNNYTVDTTATSGLWYSSLSGNPTDIPVDVVMSWYPYMDVAGTGQIYGATVNTKTVSIAGTSSAPAISSITSSTATVNCNFVANVTESTTSAQVEYKRTVDSSWTAGGSPYTTGTGYGTTAITAINLTGLTSSTAYDVRLVTTRTTANDVTITSATTSFNTLAGEPEVTTDAATSVAATSANLNSTVTINAGTTVTTYWKYGIQDPPTDTTTASQSVSTSGSFNVAITGLTASTTYYAQAFVAFTLPSGTPNNGSVVTFSTSADPAAEAASEDHLTIQEYDAVYGVQKAFVFLAASPSATSSNLFLSAAAPWATTECRITKDGGTVADCTNAPTRIGTSAFYTITLTATEMQAENIWVHINDTGAAARDVAIHVRTSIEVGKFIANALQMTNTTAFLCTGIGSGHGASFVAGATGFDIDGILGQHVQRGATATAGGASTITLDASASSTNSYYNGSIIMIVGGTGAGQSRVITGYVGGTLVATVHKAWATNPASGSIFVILGGDDTWEIPGGAELAALPTFASSMGKHLQFLFQRFMYGRAMTATLFTMYKDDGTTPLFTAAMADNGTTQTHAELA